MKTKPITPYQRLLTEVREFYFKVRHPHRAKMWHYPKATIAGPWNLTDLAERVRAADQLGYDVHLEWLDDGLHVIYVKRAPKMWAWE